MTFNPANFIAGLSYLVSGWLGIFVVIGIIIIATVILNKVFTEKKDQQ